MSHRFVLARVIVPVVLAGLAFGCGGGTATGNLDQLQVAVTQSEIQLTNTSGATLMDVAVEIEPAGPASHFKAHLARLENGQKTSLSFGNFTDRDSVPFSPRNAKARFVTVSGQDIHGKPVQVRVPYKYAK